MQGAAPAPDPDLDRQREVVDAFLAASRGGDFDALVALLDPDVVLRADGGAAARRRVARGPRRGGRGRGGAPLRVRGALARPALINGAAGFVVVPGERAVAVIGFTVAHGRIVAMDMLADPDGCASWT